MNGLPFVPLLENGAFLQIIFVVVSGTKFSKSKLEIPEYAPERLYLCLVLTSTNPNLIWKIGV